MGRLASRCLVLGALAALASGCAALKEEAAAPPVAEPEPPAVDRTRAAEDLLADALVHRAPARPAAALPAGFRERRVPDAHLTFATPPGWQALRNHEARHPGVIAMFGGLNADLGLAIASLAPADSPMKLVAFDPAFRDGFATTASVLQTPVRTPVPYASWAPEVLKAAQELRSLVGGVRSRRVELPFGEALRLSYRRRLGGPEGRVVSVLQYVLVRGSNETIVTFTTLPRLLDGYLRDFERAARTLQPA